MPTLLDQFPRSSTKADIPHFFRLSWSFTTQDVHYDFRAPTFLRSKGGVSSKHFVNNHPKGIDICLLRNLVIKQAELLGIE